MNIRVPKMPQALLSQPLSQVPSMAPPCLRPGPDPVLSPRKESSQRQRSVRKRRVHLPETRCGEAGRPAQLSGRSSCYPGQPAARRVAGPEGQVAEGEPSRPERAGLTLPPSPTSSLSRLPTAMPTGPGGAGTSAPRTGCARARRAPRRGGGSLRPRT